MSKSKTRIFPKGALQALSSNYWRVVEGLAEVQRERFESGELHGYRYNEEYEAKYIDERGTEPIYRLKEQVERDLVPDVQTAYVILACSPSEEDDIDGGSCLAEVRWAAAECIVIDVFRLARKSGWWKPRRDEYIGHSEWERVRRRYDKDAQARRAA